MVSSGRFPPNQSRAVVTVPSTIRRWCDAPKCRTEMDWRLIRPNPSRIGKGIGVVVYECVQSQDRVAFVLNFLPSESANRVALIGCWPEPRPLFSADLRGGLGEIGQHLYASAIACRGAGRGIGAVTYARRTIEHEMDSLLDLLHNLLIDEGDPLPLQRVAELKQTNSFVDKARHADTVLPPRFFPGQQNPFVTLHHLLSDGVHNLDDVESCERFDDCRDLIELLFERLHREAESKRLYAEKVKGMRPRDVRSRPQGG